MGKIEVYKTLNLLNGLIIDKKKQIKLVKEYGVSKGWVSTLAKRVRNLKYLPRIKDNSVVCLVCGKVGTDKTKARLGIHHDHFNGLPIAILCPRCNQKAGNETNFKGEISSNWGFSNGNHGFDNYSEYIKIGGNMKGWFTKQAEMRGWKLVSFLKKIPDIIPRLEEQLDKKDNIILTLKEENSALKDFFDGLCIDPSHDFMKIDIFEYDKFKKKWLDEIETKKSLEGEL